MITSHTYSVHRENISPDTYFIKQFFLSRKSNICSTKELKMRILWTYSSTLEKSMPRWLSMRKRRRCCCLGPVNTLSFKLGTLSYNIKHQVTNLWVRLDSSLKLDAQVSWVVKSGVLFCLFFSLEAPTMSLRILLERRMSGVPSLTCCLYKPISDNGWIDAVRILDNM